MVTKRANTPGPYILRNYKVEKPTPYAGECGWLVCEAARATSAAPFYFAPLKKGKELYLDGGVGYNNPANLVVEEVVAMTGLPSSECINTLVSLGCGVPTNSAQPGQPGFLQKFFSTANQLLDALVAQVADSIGTHNYMQWASDRDKYKYFRFSPQLSGEAKLDIADPMELQQLLDLSEKYIKQPAVQNMLKELAVLLSH